METLEKELELPKWLQDDNNARNADYARNLNEENFLRELNEHLRQSSPQFSDSIATPVLFFFGVPRCGKTFFSQMLNHYFDLGFPDNLVARFWRAPYYGIRLSQLLKNKFDTGSDFQSDFGKTKNLFDPHDFAYFWHEHLRKDSHPYDFENARDQIDWEKLQSQLAIFSQCFGKACLFKGVNPSYHMSLMARKIPNTFFIYLERDLIDSAVSLARARVKNYSDINHWYGQNPSPEVFERLKNLPWNEQIAGQFKWLTQHFEKELSTMSRDRYIRVSYKDFCDNPTGFFQKLKAKISEKMNHELVQKAEVKEGSLIYSEHTEETEYYMELLEAFNKIDLMPRMSLNGKP